MAKHDHSGNNSQEDQWQSVPSESEGSQNEGVCKEKAERRGDPQVLNVLDGTVHMSSNEECPPPTFLGPTCTLSDAEIADSYFQTIRIPILFKFKRHFRPV